VDDEPHNLNLLEAILSPLGYVVVKAVNGLEALEKIRTERIDICLLDVMMPGMDGFEVCRRIKADVLYRNIPVVMITAFADTENRILGIEAGAEDFISNPFNSAEVLARIKMLLQVKSLNDRLQSAYSDLASLNTDLAARAAELEVVNLELKASAAELEAANVELEAANVELEAFNYTVAHDLRNPLNVISSYCQMIKEFYGDKLDEKCLFYIQQAYESTLHMNQLIEALLQFSRLAHAELNRERVDLSCMAKELVEDLKGSETARRVEIRIVDGIVVDGDANLLRAVLANLLGNAWKYTTTREEAVIEFAVTEIDGKPVFLIRDNGAGFDMADAAKLFVPFQRLPGAEEYRGGFGIGLATVERIIRRHGGRVWAEGEPGKGATFYFTLDQAKEHGRNRVVVAAGM
jgi:signal transduction histidine kinase